MERKGVRRQAEMKTLYWIYMILLQKSASTSLKVTSLNLLNEYIKPYSKADRILLVPSCTSSPFFFFLHFSISLSATEYTKVYHFNNYSCKLCVLIFPCAIVYIFITTIPMTQKEIRIFWWQVWLLWRFFFQNYQLN